MTFVPVDWIPAGVDPNTGKMTFVHPSITRGEQIRQQHRDGTPSSNNSNQTEQADRAVSGVEIGEPSISETVGTSGVDSGRACLEDRVGDSSWLGDASGSVGLRPLVSEEVFVASSLLCEPRVYRSLLHTDFYADHYHNSYSQI